MHVIKPKNVSENEQGSALVYTLMVLLLLSLLGMSVGMVTVGSYKLSDSNRDYTSAYYIAEAGANTAYEEIQTLVNNEYKLNPKNPMMKSNPLNYILKSARDWNISITGDSAAKKVYSKDYHFEGQFGSATNAIIAVKALTEDNATEFIIESIGTVDQKERVVQKKFEITWPEDKGSGGGIKVPPNAVLLADQKVKLLGGGLLGDIHTNSTINKTVEFGDYGEWKQSTIYHSSLISKNALLSYKDGYDSHLPKMKATDEMIDFGYYRQLIDEVNLPQNIDGKIQKNDLTGEAYEVRGAGDVIISENGNTINMKVNNDSYIPEFRISGLRKVVLDIGNKDKVIVTDKFSLGGIIEIQGTGNLTIYVNDKFEYTQGSSTINLNGQLGKVTFVYLGKEDLDFGNAMKINGHIVAKYAGLKSGSIPFNGVFLAGGTNITLQGGGMNEGLLLIAPNAKVTMSGSYSVNGTIVSKEFEIGGGSWLKYKEVNTDSFPFGGTGGNTQQDKELISSEPTIEPN